VAFNITQPYATVENADGTQYFLQSGVLYSAQPPYAVATLSLFPLSSQVTYNSTTGAVGTLFRAAPPASGDTSGVTDTASWTACINALNANGGWLLIPQGQWYVKGSQLPAITKPCTIQGSGRGTLDRIFGGATYNDYCTQIINVENSSPAMTVAGNSVTIRGFRLSYAGATVPTYPAINVGGVGSAAIIHKSGFHNVYEDLATDNFYIGIDIWAGQYNHVRNNWIFGSAYVGVRINDISYMDQGDNFINGNVITQSNWNAPALAGVYWMSGGGLIVTNNKFNQSLYAGNGTGVASSFYGVRVRPVSNGQHMPDGSVWASQGGSGTVDIKITNNSIENWLGTGILIEEQTAGQVNAIGLHQNQFESAASPGTQVGGVTMPSSSGSGYSVNDVLTFTTGTGTKATMKVTDISAAGAIMDYVPIQLGVYSVLPSNLGMSAQQPTGGTGTGSPYAETWPVYNIAVLGSTNIFQVQVSDNVSYTQSGGVLLSGVTSGYVGKNTWTASQNTSFVSSAIHLDGVVAAQVTNVDIEPQMYTAAFNTPNLYNYYLFTQTNGTEADSGNAYAKGNIRHEYALQMASIAVAGATSTGLFMVELGQYSTSTLEVEFTGYLGGAAKSLGAKFKRMISLEAAGGTAVCNVVDTDVAYIAGVSKTITVTSNVAAIDSGATDQVNIGIVPQASTGRVWIYVATVAGSSAITSLAGLMTIRLRGNPQKIGVGNF
jgi:hypothetical protein